MKQNNDLQHTSDNDGNLKKNGPSSTRCLSPGDHRGLLSRFLPQTHFESQDDFIRNLHFKIPERFNFAYDVMCMPPVLVRRAQDALRPHRRVVHAAGHRPWRQGYAYP